MAHTRTPPRFVPTLTEVVQARKTASTEAEVTEELLVTRVMQRVDLTLERRLREAIASTVLEQTRTIAPLLREEIEEVVRATVAQAFAEELAAQRNKK
jgi:hypothetical protein